MQRVVVAGISGAGKTTLARALSGRLQLPYVELDALYHGPRWVPRPAFVTDVEAFSSRSRWITDSAGYSAVRDLLWSRADTIVWLDLPRWQAELRVLRRSVPRGLLGRPLWNGNRESVLAWRFPDHPVRWTWTQHGAKRAQIGARLADPRWAHLQVVHLRTAGQARRWLRAVPGAPRVAPQQQP